VSVRWRIIPKGEARHETLGVLLLRTPSAFCLTVVNKWFTNGKECRAGFPPSDTLITVNNIKKMNLSLQFRSAPKVLCLAVAAIGLAGSGCNRDEARVVTVPKESAATPVTALPPGHPEPGAGAGMDMGFSMPNRPKLSYDIPADWTESSLGSMRVASFLVSKDGKQADMSVIPLGGAAGGNLANVNRWRGQVGLAPLTEQALKASAESVQLAGEPADLYDLAGTSPGSGDPMRVLGAIQNRDGTAWFFKLSGDSELVASQKSALLEFLKSVKFETPEMHGLPASHPPIDGMSMGNPMSVAPGPISREGQPAWSVPSGWREVSGGQFLIGKFIIPGEANVQAAVNVSASAGDGGGFANNVNRWRTQIGLAELPEAEIKRHATVVEVTGGKATFVDMSGSDQRTRVVGAMVPHGGQTWFYKLSGDAKLVAAQKEAFEKFVQSVKY
jgi:hypothetical protein